MYRIEVSPAAYRDLHKLKGKITRIDFERLRSAISSLEANPRPEGVRKIKGAERAYRIRVGTYRVVYEIFDKELLILLLEIARRNESTYRSL